MTATDLELHPEAIEEIRAQYRWYAARNPAAAEAFFTEIETAFTAILNAPERWPAFRHGTRRYLLRRFPFSVVYRQISSSLQIVAVVHGKRRPDYWRRRK